MNRIKYILFLLILTSCVENVDFDQSDEFIINPVLETSVIFFNEPANTFFLNNAGEEVQEVKDSAVVNFFNGDFVVDNLVKAEFTFKIKNSIKRIFQTRVDFLDDEGDLTHTFTITAANSLDNEEVITDHIEVFEDDTLLALKATQTIAITAILPPSNDGTVITKNTIGRIDFDSKATFYLNINTSE